MRKTISVKWLEQKGACSEAIREFKTQNERATDRILALLVERGQLDWASWLIARLCTKRQRVEYAVFAAKQVIEWFEWRHPDDKRPREAIEAAEAWLRKPSAKTKSAAYVAATYASYAAWTDPAAAAGYASYAAWTDPADPVYADAAADAAAAAYVAATYASAADADAAARLKMRSRIVRYGMSILMRSAK